MTEAELQQIQLLTDIKNEISTTKQYFVDRDAAAKLAAEQNAASAASAASAAETSLIEFRQLVLDSLAALDVPDPVAENDYTSLLQEIKENTQSSAEPSSLEQASYNADIAITFLVVYLLPIYVSYRLIKSLFSYFMQAFG